MSFEVLNHGQVTRTKPKKIPLLLTSITTEGHLSLVIFNVHGSPVHDSLLGSRLFLSECLDNGVSGTEGLLVAYPIALAERPTTSTDGTCSDLHKKNFQLFLHAEESSCLLDLCCWKSPENVWNDISLHLIIHWTDLINLMSHQDSLNIDDKLEYFIMVYNHTKLPALLTLTATRSPQHQISYLGIIFS
ncbi:hypothetical protein TNCV_826281 [Trichonephila clavipes]|nr:hypothetical protein TNCV_826281 [Trichonephila clavipes]